MDTENIPTDADAVHCMRQFGGSFIKCLAECWLTADPMNKAKLKIAFPVEFQRYRAHAARAAKGPAHYTDMAREAAERTGEPILPEHRA